MPALRRHRLQLQRGSPQQPCRHRFARRRAKPRASEYSRAEMTIWWRDRGCLPGAGVPADRFPVLVGQQLRAAHTGEATADNHHVRTGRLLHRSMLAPVARSRGRTGQMPLVRASLSPPQLAVPGHRDHTFRGGRRRILSALVVVVFLQCLFVLCLASALRLQVPRQMAFGATDASPVLSAMVTTASMHVAKKGGRPSSRPPFLLLIAELAARQLEACNPGQPARRRGGLASGGVVLVGVPEGAVVNRVDVE